MKRLIAGCLLGMMLSLAVAQEAELTLQVEISPDVQAMLLAREKFRFVVKRLNIISKLGLNNRSITKELPMRWQNTVYAQGDRILREKLVAAIGEERVHSEECMRPKLDQADGVFQNKDLYDDESLARMQASADNYKLDPVINNRLLHQATLFHRVMSPGVQATEEEAVFLNEMDMLAQSAKLYDGKASKELMNGKLRWLTLAQDHGEEVKMGLPVSAVPTQLNWPEMEPRSGILYRKNELIEFNSQRKLISLSFFEATPHKDPKGDAAVLEAILSKEEARMKQDYSSDIRLKKVSISRTLVGHHPALMLLEEGTNDARSRVQLTVFTPRHWIPVSLFVMDADMEKVRKVIQSEMPSFLATAATIKVKNCPDFPQDFVEYCRQKEQILKAWAGFGFIMQQLAVIQQRFPSLKNEAKAAEKAWHDSPLAEGIPELQRMVRQREGDNVARQLYDWAISPEQIMKGNPSSYAWNIWSGPLETETQARYFIDDTNEMILSHKKISDVSPNCDDSWLWPLCAYHPRYRENRLLEVSDGMIKNWLVPSGKDCLIQLSTPISFYQLNAYDGLSDLLLAMLPVDKHLNGNSSLNFICNRLSEKNDLSAGALNNVLKAEEQELHSNPLYKDSNFRRIVIQNHVALLRASMPMSDGNGVLILEREFIFFNATHRFSFCFYFRCHEGLSSKEMNAIFEKNMPLFLEIASSVKVLNGPFKLPQPRLILKQN